MAKIRQFDEETGEILEGYIAVLQPKRRNAFGEGWFAMAQAGLVALINALVSGELHSRDLQVLMYMMSILDFENLIQVQQADVASALKMQRPHVNRSVKRLIEVGVLLEGPKIGRVRSYRLNLNYGWKGSAKNHRKALSERLAAANISGIVSS